MFSYFWGRANWASKGTPYFLERSFIAQKTVQFSLKITQRVPENSMWLTPPETVKPGFLFFQNHLHSNPHVGSIHVPPQQVCRASREPVRLDTIARGFWTIFQTRPLVVAFADIPGVATSVCQEAQPWSSQCRPRCPGRGSPGGCSQRSRLPLGDGNRLLPGCCHPRGMAVLLALPRAAAETHHLQALRWELSGQSKASPNSSTCASSGSQVTSKRLVTQRRGRARVPASPSIPRLAGTAECAVQTVTRRDRRALRWESQRWGMGGKLARVIGSPSLAWKPLSLCTKIRHNSSVIGGDLYTSSG